MRGPLLVAASAATVAVIVSLSCGSRREEAPDRIAGWRGDLERLVTEARRLHASPTRPAHGPEFAQAATEVSRRIADLPDQRIVVEFQRLLAMLGDGHSLVYPMPIPRAPFDMLPVDLYLFEDGLFIVGAVGPEQELVGSRILRFGSLATEDVLQRMEPLISRDNAMGLKAFIQLYGIIPAFLEAVGATDDPARVTLTVVDAQSRTRPSTLAAGPARRPRRRLDAPTGGPEPVPLYLQQPEREYWIRALPEAGALYLQFNQVADAADAPLDAFAARLHDALASAQADSLIVDVRHNTGGNNGLLQPLIDTIAGFAAGSPRRRVYVMTSRATFSAAQNFITRVERRVPGAVFAGEPSMSSPNFTGEDNPVTLPFSGLAVSISNRYWQDSDPIDHRPWIAPHIAVGLSSQDWLGNKDPVLDAVLKAIAAQQTAGSERKTPG